ncbi:MAG: LlaJI family restriction endonuclease [Acholeplasmataceae bacterium]|jgi:hypothetical protein|nr:LlaJI family restriction endonuclease [Acholeplasmataceae bacterium]
METKSNKPILRPVIGDNFIGLRVEDNKLIFDYPATYRINESDDRELISQIKKILKTISHTTQSEQYNSLYEQNSELQPKSEVSLRAYIYIIDDYITNGKYRNLERIIKKENRGKINWKKTLKQVPYFQDGIPIYQNIYTEHNSQYDDVIVDIYKHCLKIAIKVLGWLFDIEEDEYIKNTMYQYDDEIKDYFLQVIQKELSQTFNDKKRHRLITMREIISGLNSKETNYKVYGVDKYWPVFEYMLRSMFENIDKEQYKELYPNTWWILNGEKQKEQRALRPDIIYEETGEYYIVIDAKYYAYGYTKNPDHLPKSSDIFKQFVYSDNVKYVTDEKTVYNCFIMPFNKVDDSEENYKEIGFAISTNREEKDKIKGILIDLTFLIEEYSKKNREIEAKRIYKLIST